MRPSRRIRTLAAVTATVAILGPIGWLWQDSLMLGPYSVMDMGSPDLGGGSGPGHAHGGSSVELLASPAGEPDVRLTVTARQERFRLGSGRLVDGYTLNGTSPGPVLRAVQGQRVEVVLRNESVADHVTLHWHGIDVPNAADGVAGVTQDAVPVGGEHVYRFTADRAGSYWYHSHQKSHEQVPGGLFGAVVIAPRRTPPVADDLVALVHLYGGERTINGRADDTSVAAAAGDTVRVRVINTDNGPMPVWVSGSPFRVVAVDGTDVNRPTPVADTAVSVTAGGRADLELTVPDGGARVEMGGSAALVLGEPVRAEPRPGQTLDLLAYGSAAQLGFDPGRPDRRFDYAISRRPGFVRGLPGMWWSVNGGTYPDVPMFMVAEGDVVRVRISNSSGEVHPMHLHGHHMVVLARDGVRATGSPWWVDSLNVADGETYDVAFVADNPGAWMFHCHHLGHAADGFVAHLMYQGVIVPFRLGDGNEPE